MTRIVHYLAISNEVLFARAIPDLQRSLPSSAVQSVAGCQLLSPEHFLQAVHRARQCLDLPRVPSTWGKTISVQQGDRRSCPSEQVGIPPQCDSPVHGLFYPLVSCKGHSLFPYKTNAKRCGNLSFRPIFHFHFFENRSGNNTHALFLPKPISSRLSNVVCSAMLT